MLFQLYTMLDIAFKTEESVFILTRYVTFNMEETVPVFLLFLFLEATENHRSEGRVAYNNTRLRRANDFRFGEGCVIRLTAKIIVIITFLPFEVTL